MDIITFRQRPNRHYSIPQDDSGLAENDFTMTEKRFPEVYDLVAITIKQVDYYGYVDNIDYDMRDPRIKVEFYPGHASWFRFDECRLVEYPEDK